MLNYLKIYKNEKHEYYYSDYTSDILVELIDTYKDTYQQYMHYKVHISKVNKKSATSFN